MHTVSTASSFVPYPALLFVALQFPLAWSLSWPNWTLASLALGWLLYRAHLVLKLPIDELVNILGLEVPSAPTVYLLAVSSDSVALHWKPTEPRHATSKYLVRVNGIQVGAEQASNITAVTLGNLPSGQLYNIRVVAINAASFQASSEALYVRTLNSLSSDGIGNATQDTEALRQPSDAVSAGRVPTVTVLKGFAEALTPNLGPHSMIREPSSSNLQSKRRASDRRSSPVIHAQDAQRRRVSGADASAEAREDVKPLTERLDSLQREIKDVSQQDQAEEEEFDARKIALSVERDNLRAQLKEKEEGSKDLKKSVTSLERANTAAQSKKAAQEKVLQQKKMERQKMEDDKIRWARELVEMQQESEDLVRLKKEHAEKTESQVEDIRQEQNPDLDKIKELEERIRDRGTQVKELEEVRKALDEQLDSEDAGEAKAAEDEMAYQHTMRALQAKYHQAWHELSQAQIHYQQTQGRLNMLQSRRGSQSNFMLPTSNDFPPEFIPASAAAAATAAAAAAAGNAANDTQRAAEQQAYTSFSSGYNRYPHIPHSRSPAGFNPVPRTSSPFFNASNLASAQPPRSLERIPQADIENLTGGALASPGASMLLPSDLLGDDPYDAMDQRFSPPRRVDSDRSQHSRPSSTAPGSTHHGRSGDATRAGFVSPLPGLGTVPGTLGGMDSAVSLQHIPSSPNSQHSESPHSLFASPHGSMSNFHAHRVSEGTADSDRRSLHSVSSSTGAARTPGRFSSFFGRQRGKTASTDGPELGTLKASKTQSMPRSTDWEETQNAFSLGQRKGAAGTLLGQVGNSLLGRRERFGNRHAADLNISGPLDERPASSNIWAFQPMGSGTSRPASVYSENVVPARSDMDSRAFVGWSSSTTDVNRSNSTRTGHALRNPWSSSRRASVQADNADQLATDGGGLSEDDDYGPGQAASPPQAPIGTRPIKESNDSGAGVASAIAAHNLNPAARDFRSIFKKKAKTATPSAATDEDSRDASPRMSREQQRQASSADASTEDVSSTRGADSSVPATPVETPSTPQPGSGNRDSLMRKIARKGSSTKFALGSISGRDKSASSSTTGSFFSRRSNNNNSNAAAPTIETDSANATTDEDGGSIAPGRSLESLPGTPLGPESASRDSKRSSGFSLSSFGKSRRGRKANDAPSISETSMTSASASAGAVTDDEGMANERVSVDDFADR